MASSLNSLIILSPTILGSTLSIESTILPLQIQGDLNTTNISIILNGTTTNYSTYTVVGNNHVFAINLALPTIQGSYPLVITGNDITNTVYTPTLGLTLIVASDADSLRTLPPSGVTLYRRRDTFKIEWATPTITGFLGVKVAVSSDSTGITSPFTQIGTLISAVSRTANSVLSTNTSTVVDTVNNTTTTTTVNNTITVNYSSIELAKTTNNLSDVFYVVLSTIVQDPVTNHIFESKYNGPFKGSFIDLRTVNLTDFLALQNQGDIAARIINNINTANPTLDLSPRSELRDLLVDPFAIELSYASVREWFNRISGSISALSQFDDYDGDGISDPLTSSSLKQSVQAAFGIDSNNFQFFIDRQFDILGEEAGIPRTAATPAVGTLQIFTTSLPTTQVTIDTNAIVATQQDDITPAANFQVQSTTIISPSNAAAYYDPVSNIWAVSVPIQCTTPGSIGTVGAGTITVPIAGIPPGWQVRNLTGTEEGSDAESNIQYAARIKERKILGMDTGTKPGLDALTRSIPGVLDVNVVGANDINMLRDWDPVRQKHIYGSVDIYVKGVAQAQNSSKIPFKYITTGTYGSLNSYAILNLVDPSTLKFKLANPSLYPYHPLSPIEFYVDRGNSTSFYFGLDNATVDSNNYITLSPTDIPYQILNGVKTNLNTTNLGFIGQVQGATLRGFISLDSGIDLVPTIQPVSSVSSIAGETGLTGAINPKNYRIVKKQDPLLLGNSNQSTDEVVVDQQLVLKTKTTRFVTAGPTSLYIDEGIILDSLNNVVAVRNSLNLSILYKLGIDYTITPNGRFGKFNINWISTGNIPLDTDIIVSYNQNSFIERTILISNEAHTLTTTPVQLNNSGFIHNVWMPVAHGQTTLVNDSTLSSIPYNSRYIKVTYDNGTGPQVMLENQDYVISVNESTGVCTIARSINPGTRIPDKGSVLVTYYRNEIMSVNTLYPSYITAVSTAVNAIKHAGADIVIKDLVHNTVDMEFTVNIDSTANAQVLDSAIRSAISVTTDNAKSSLTQSSIIKAICSITGVDSVVLPMRRFAKSDGSYVVGHIVPTGTSWTKVANDSLTASLNLPTGAYISTSSVLPFSTIPSGGTQDSYVGMLYEGSSFTRLLSLTAMQNQATPCFYIIGSGDTPSSADIGRIVFLPPSYITDPSLFAYRVTYQVYGEPGPADITISPTEFIRPGNIAIDYIQVD